MDKQPKPISNIAPFGLRMQPALKQKIEESAKANARSLNAEIVARLENSFTTETTLDPRQLRTLLESEEFVNGVVEKTVNGLMEKIDTTAIAEAFLARMTKK